MDVEFTMVFILGVGMGLILAVLIFMVPLDIKISQETGDDICKQLTGNESAIAEEEYNQLYGGKLICITPSYDATQNIVFKQNNE